MSLADLETVLEWAADEGWNPGLDDASAFLAADPDGFLIRKLAGRPVSAISVVNHSDSFAFLGLYLCHPDFRGHGHGLAIWRAGLAHAGGRTIGLDGVPAQEANYARSGFIRHGGTARFTAACDPARSRATRPVQTTDIPDLIERERRSTGVDADRFLDAWFRDTSTRRTLLLEDAGGLAGYATVRTCQADRKIGPFQAKDEKTARILLGDLAGIFGAGPISLDVPQDANGLRSLLEGAGFRPSFSTARMYKGAPPPSRPDDFRSVATLELG
jgi:hypothetical protein